MHLLEAETRIVLENPTRMVAIMVLEGPFWMLWSVSLALELAQLVAGTVLLVCETGSSLGVCRNSTPSPIVLTILGFAIVESVIRILLLSFGILFRLFRGNVVTLWRIYTDSTSQILTERSAAWLRPIRADSWLQQRAFTGYDRVELNPVDLNKEHVCCYSPSFTKRSSIAINRFSADPFFESVSIKSKARLQSVKAI